MIVANRFTVIDEKTWDRAMHCRVFRDYLEPAFCITFEVDVTNFRQKAHEQGLSFTLAMVYAVCRCAGEIPAFRYRFQDGNVVLFDTVDTAFTYLAAGTDMFKVVRVPMQRDLCAYVELAAKTAAEQKEYFTGPLGNDIFQCSALPWVSYTHISHTNAGRKDNATPLFDWGKYVDKNERLIMPISVQAHHSFVDGLHVGQFADKLQQFLDQYPAPPATLLCGV